LRPKELLSKIALVESSLNEFSFEELNVDQATTLKQTFENFTFQLQEIIAAKSVAAGVIPEAEKTDSKTVESRLITDVSRELSTPLNGIIDLTDLLKEDELNTMQLERVIKIQTASQAIIEIVQEVVEFSKLSAGLEPFESIDFNFYRLLRDVVYICHTLIVQKNVTIELAIDPDIPEVLIGDPAKLSQVLLNLLGNAIKYVGEGQIHFNVVLKKKNKDTLTIDFTIADNGLGIAEEEFPFIFDSFHQADTGGSTAQGGTGLGLNILKQIVGNLGGDISVTSNLNHGSTFKFCLPYAPGNKEKLRKNDTVKEYLQDAAKLLKGTRILVFEDNPINQRLIERRLQKWGCIVFVTENGAYGLNLLEEQEIDLILTDLRMPGMSGFEITECIRNHKSQAISELPVIALTGDFTIRDNDTSETHGFNDYLLKPYSPDELLMKLLANKKSMEKKLNLSESTPEILSNKNKETEEFSLDSIFNDCMQQVDLVKELVQLYRQNVLEFIGEVKMYLLQEDFEKLGFSLHKMKSGLAMMRTNELLEIVKQMERCCKAEKDLKHLNFLFECFLNEYPMTESKISTELDRLQKK